MIKVPVTCDMQLKAPLLAICEPAYLNVLDGDGKLLLKVPGREGEMVEELKERAYQIVFALNYHFAVTEEDDPIKVLIAD